MRSLAYLPVFVGVCLATSLNAEEPSRAVEWTMPLIKSDGKIVELPRAGAQPRAGSKVVFDISVQEKPDDVAKGLVRVARWLNLNAAADIPSSQIQVALVLHGDATKAALDHASYAKHSQVKRNPNLMLLHELQSHGVEVYVCGQALAHHGYRSAEVAEHVEIATAALTVLIQKQQEGYAFLPY